MNKTLLITAVFGWLALSQTAHAHDGAPTEAPVSPQAIAQQHHLTDTSTHLKMVQVADPAPSPQATHSQVRDERNRGGMPSVPIGLAGLFVMICVLVRRHNA